MSAYGAAGECEMASTGDWGFWMTTAIYGIWAARIFGWATDIFATPSEQGALYLATLPLAMGAIAATRRADSTKRPPPAPCFRECSCLRRPFQSRS